MKDATLERLNGCTMKGRSRLEFWAEFVREFQIRRMAEVGVYQGVFSGFLLRNSPLLEKYYMVDPWRHLEDWNKPANTDDAAFQRIFEAAQQNTSFAEARRIILRGKTTEVIDSIPDGELDFAYIDGDHTLKGIAIDMVRVFPKVKVNGYLGGDDFTRSMWQHKASFEPTLVFPFAVYYAEAMGATIYALPYSQFCLHKTADPQFRFVDTTGRYSDLGLRGQLTPAAVLKRLIINRFGWLANMIRRR